MIKISVNTNTPYDVIIGKRVLETALPIALGGLGLKSMVITDSGVPESILSKVETALKRIGKTVFRYTFKRGERSKNQDVLFDILSCLATNGFSRDDTVFAVGGGVVGDVAGLVACLYMRGIKYVQVPTTLLSAVDSSVGGKTAINIAEGKNLVGAFYQPSLVLCDIENFSSLERKEIKNGYAEIIKTALLVGGNLWQLVKGGLTDEEDLVKAISLCVEYKAEIVALDERENSKRRLLNLGHTIGHAIERAENLSVSHGVCVAKGLYKILKISKDRGMDIAEFDEAVSTLKLYGFELEHDYSGSKIKDNLKLDKKAEKGGIWLVLLSGIGKPYVEKMSFDKLCELL